MVKCKNCKMLCLLADDNGEKYPWCFAIDDSPNTDVLRECNHFITGTNTDRIHVMDDEELAEFLVNVETHGYHDQSVSGTLEMLDWLQSEVEE